MTKLRKYFGKWSTYFNNKNSWTGVPVVLAFFKALAEGWQLRMCRL